MAGATKGKADTSHILASFFVDVLATSSFHDLSSHCPLTTSFGTTSRLSQQLPTLISLRILSHDIFWTSTMDILSQHPFMTSHWALFPALLRNLCGSPLKGLPSSHNVLADSFQDFCLQDLTKRLFKPFPGQISVPPPTTSFGSSSREPACCAAALKHKAQTRNVSAQVTKPAAAIPASPCEWTWRPPAYPASHDVGRLDARRELARGL